MNEYTYNGVVVDQFGTCIDRCWKASTYAASEKKAKSNLTYRYKKDHNLAPGSKITLPGKIVTV